MKRAALHQIPLFLLIFLCLTACQGEPQETLPPAADVAQAILDSQPGLPALESLILEDDAFSSYVEQYYQIPAGDVEDGIIYYAGGMEASEIAVLTLTEDADPPEAALQAYITSRAGDFMGYVPAQAAMAERGLTAASGRVAALLICPDPEEAQTAFLACFGETPPPVTTVPPAETPPPETQQPETLPPETEPPAETPAAETFPPVETPEPAKVETTPPETEAPPETVPPQTEPPVPETAPPAETEPPIPDSFDPKAIVEVWHSGEPGRLSEKNQLILNRCSEVIAANITDQMSEYEKELAIHDWITGWAEYDPEASSHAPDARPDPDNNNPYGILYQKVGICQGYSSTFQLFMDLLGIECITVEGTAYNGTEEHAWNMVRLDGEWYCVDVTWDDPAGLFWKDEKLQHNYFNVTSQKLRDTNHQWDEASVPEATATTYGWK